ncbi:MAG TPA: LytR C-terminal domain-containing protein, partial [Miltoncostaeaceae bacterium]|nr:LytR C-terminal domain-containing protein [Miltoncostaeaceae bacterium]
TTISGFAAQTATRARALGYPDPSAGNAPSGSGPTVVYFRPGQRDAARRVAQDLGFSSIRALPAGGPIATAAPAGAQVVVVLGPA